jgi:glycosyltransferase involved in cell wall biosynthesis
MSSARLRLSSDLSMSRILLVQPDPHGTLSGGFLYNAQMAENGAWRLVGVDPHEINTRVDEIDCDLLIADSLWLSERWVEPFLRAAGRFPVAFLMHSFPSMIAAAETEQPVATAPTAFERASLEAIGLAIVPGPHYAALLSNSKVDVRVAEPGIADAWRVPPRRRIGACSMVSIGAVTPRKGFLDVLTAMRDRRTKHEWRWTAVGSLTAAPEYAQRVEAAARRFPGAGLVGQRPPNEARDVVTAADVLVMPSYDENHPLVLTEAIAASVPPVAYDVGGAANIVSHGVEGLLGPIGDTARLGELLLRLIDDEDQRFRLAEACWQRQKRLPTWAIAAAKIRAELESIIAHR